MADQPQLNVSARLHSGKLFLGRGRQLFLGLEAIFAELMIYLDGD